ncbi:hypothetical protein ACLB2K_068321 [Fragaria x ananassa]
MATILESIVGPRSSALPSATLSPIAASSVSSCTGRFGLPHFTGLKVRSALPTSRSVGSLTYGPSHRRRGSPSLSHRCFSLCRHASSHRRRGSPSLSHRCFSRCRHASSHLRPLQL